MAGRIPVACGIDIGSTNTKAIALDQDGVVVARASRPTPRDNQGLVIDARVLRESVEDLVARICGDTYVVHAVSAAGVGEDGVLVDAMMEPLTVALAWFDPRRQSIFRDIRADLSGDAVFDVDTDPARTIVGWRWARGQSSEAPHHWLALADIVTATWTSTPFMSDTIAARTGAWRSADRAWATERVTATLGGTSLLPPVRAAGETVGSLIAPKLRNEGLASHDAIAVAGGHDHPVGAWGVAQLVPNVILDSMGTAEVVVATTPAPLTDPRSPGVDLAPAIGADGVFRLRVEELARNVEWAAQDRDVARHIRGLLSGSEHSEPVLDAGYFRPGQRGGGRPSYAPDAPRDPRARASAVLGALAHAGATAIDAVAAGDGPREVRIAGGWIRSPGWIDIKATVSGRRTAAILEPEVTAVGAALLAAHARGWSPDPMTALAGLSALSTR